MATETSQTSRQEAARKKGAKTIAKEYFEAVGNQDVEKMMSMWEPGGKGYIYGMVDLEVPDTYSAWFRNLFRAFPDFRFEVLDIVAAGDQAAVALARHGHLRRAGEVRGPEPDRRRVELEGIDLLTDPRRQDPPEPRLHQRHRDGAPDGRDAAGRLGRREADAELGQRPHRRRRRTPQAPRPRLSAGGAAARASVRALALLRPQGRLHAELAVVLD